MPPTSKEQERTYKDTLRVIEDTLFENYACLLPVGEVSVSIVLPWPKEAILGEFQASWENPFLGAGQDL